ncbi:uncharacterized protein LOC130635467 [Hydractinia symbiolongicarpus]|uniref:uncharacterized protein LOC130635467 n=1 Tax=Hydractinia symbiolongicarpus TaxID=13093 RepID=UPI00254BF0DC|nr:uncharacterized protein LOC130635467 [Hydractinia symbiolongicarpus]
MTGKRSTFYCLVFAVLHYICCDVPITDIFRCDFEDDVCGFTSSPPNLFQRNRGGTPSNLTGPTAAPEGDYYVFYEASESENTAIFESKIIDARNGWRNFSISFWLHAYGIHLGGLDLLIVSATQEVLETFNITAPSSEKWKTVTKFFNPTKGNGNGLFKVRFMVTRKGYSADFALDSLWIGAYMDYYPVTCTATKCAPNSVCQQSFDFVGCTCNAGFVGNGFESFNVATGCNAHGNCSTNPCDVNAICSLAICSCKPGFVGNGVKRSIKGGTRCLDLNECVTLDVCGTNEICINTPGGYKCVCKPYFHKPVAEGATCIENTFTDALNTNLNTNKPSKEISSSVTTKKSTQTKKKMTAPLYKPSDTEKSSKTDLTIMYIIVASIGGILIVIALVAVCIYREKSGFREKNKHISKEESNIYTSGNENTSLSKSPPSIPVKQEPNVIIPLESPVHSNGCNYESEGYYTEMIDGTDFPNYTQPNVTESYEVNNIDLKL